MNTWITVSISKIYVLAPFSENIHSSKVKIELYRKQVLSCGYIPSTPYLEFSSLVTGDPVQKKEKLERLCFMELKRCDMLIICGDMSEYNDFMKSIIRQAYKRSIPLATLESILLILNSFVSR